MDTSAAAAATTANDATTPIATVEKPTAAPVEPVVIAVAEVSVTNGNGTTEAEAPVVNGSAAVVNGSADAVPEVKPRTVAPEVSEPIVTDDVVTTTAAIPELDIPAATHIVVNVPIAAEPAEKVALAAAVPELDIPAATHVVANAALAAEPIETVEVTAAVPELDIPAATHVAAPLTGLLGLPQYAQQAIKEFAVREGFSYFETKVEQDNTSADRFVGEIYAVTLTGTQTRNDIANTDAKLELIVKLPSTNVAAEEPVAIVELVAAPAISAEPIAAVATAIITTPVVAEPVPAATQPPTGLLGLPEYVQQAIKEIAVREGFSFFETKVGQGQNTGDGFVGDIFKVTLTGTQTRNGVAYADADLALIVKLPPTNAMRREFVAMKLFEREVFVYSELLPAFVKFQAEHGLRPGTAGFHSFPKCYHAHFDRASDQAVIILENLLDSGFAMESKFVSVKFEYARTVLEKLAELHGISLAMKQQRPDVFERFRTLSDVTAASSDQERDLVGKMLANNVAQALTVLDATETTLRDKVQRAADVLVSEANRYAGDLNEPYSVITHGDCWVNNMMFKHESGQSRQVSFYDWQCTRYTTPILDIVYFLFLCTDAELRARYYDDLIQAYHHALRAQLDRLNADVNELFPFTAMLRQLKQYGRYALGPAIMVVPMLCTAKSELPNMDKLVEGIEKSGKDWDGTVFTMTDAAKKTFALRMGGILRDMNRKGFF